MCNEDYLRVIIEYEQKCEFVMEKLKTDEKVGRYIRNILDIAQDLCEKDLQKTNVKQNI